MINAAARSTRPPLRCGGSLASATHRSPLHDGVVPFRCEKYSVRSRLSATAIRSDQVIMPRP